MNILRRNKNAVMLCACILLHTLFLYIICDFDKALETYGDELIYYSLARSIFRGEGLKLHGIAFQFQNLAYCYYLAPFFYITDSVLRMHAVTLANSFLISLSVIPVWLICKELNLNKKFSWFTAALIMLWPDMLTAGTVMSENLYWLLSLFAIYFCIRSADTDKKFPAVTAAVCCYMAYFCKEVGVCLALAYIAFTVMDPFVERLFGNSRPCHKFFKEGGWIKPVVFMAAYGMCYLVFKGILFKNIGSAYSYAVETSIFTNGYKCLYLLYAFVYCVLASVVAFMVFPVLYPVLYFRKISEKTRKAYLYAVILLLGTIAVVVIKITINEDLGWVRPRVHIRYFASIAGLFFPVFFRAVSETDLHRVYVAERKKVSATFWVLFWIICTLIYKGVRGACVNENLPLFYAQKAAEWLTDLKIDREQSVIFYTSAIVINAAIGIVLLVWNLLQHSGRYRKYFVSLVFATMIFVCAINFRLGASYLHAYEADGAAVEQMGVINDYFRDHGMEGCNVMLVCRDGYEKKAKIYDTYFDGTNNFETSYEMLLNKIFESGWTDITVADMYFSDRVWARTYQMDAIDYFIFDDAVYGTDFVIGGLALVPEISGTYYTVYKNIVPEKIAAPEEIEFGNADGVMAEINFIKEGYNAPLYIVKGMSLCEESFSWTDGEEMQVRARVPAGVETVNIKFDVMQPYNGRQEVCVYQGDDLIYTDIVSAGGYFSFDLHPKDGDCSFTMKFPDAVSPLELGDSTDERKLSLALRKAVITGKTDETVFQEERN